MNPIVIIPARKGSKGIPQKNVKLLNGKPLVQYTIEAALGVFNKKQICVTSDDSEIIGIAKKFGLDVPFIRPSKLSQDNTTTSDVISHALKFYSDISFDTIVLLQPTSPLRQSSHIKEALETYTASIDMVVSVVETSSNPYYVLFEEQNGYLIKSKIGNFTRRQDCPKVWEYNGAIYVINRNSFENKGFGSFDKVVKYEMNKKDSVDIDDMIDWKLASILLSEIEF